MKKILIIIGIIVAFAISIIITLNLLYRRDIKAVNNDSTLIEVEVKVGNNYHSIADTLFEHGLIRSTFVYKLYIRINPPTATLEAGFYYLSKNMSVETILGTLGAGATFNPYAPIIRIPEGRRIEEIANIVAEQTDNSKEGLLALWNSEEFIDKVIEKYWFVTEDVKKKGIRNNLEGYFFPSTYRLNDKSISPEEVAYVLLNQTELILNEYREEIESSKISVHELLTMASIVEYEAILDEDRAVIAGVFYNRLGINMKLQSCATVGYALNEWKTIYKGDDLNVDSPYNTYMYEGLPIGPGNNPGEESIIAALRPASSDYLFFLADICSGNPKTLFSKTYAEHEQKRVQYLTCE